MTVSTVDDFNGYPYPRGVPVHMRDTMRFHPETLEYWPTVYVNEFWLLKDAHVPLNASVAAANLTLTVAPLSMFKWQLYEQMERTFEHQRAMGTQGENDGDELKRIFLEGNPILLAVTSVVSVFHTVFDVLAFKNDIGFWRQNKSMEGLSARTITFNAGCQAVIFLYLLDNDTSWMVLLSSGLGLIIEGWKITKAMDVSLRRSFRLSTSGISSGIPRATPRGTTRSPCGTSRTRCTLWWDATPSTASFTTSTDRGIPSF